MKKASFVKFRFLHCMTRILAGLFVVCFFLVNPASALTALALPVRTELEERQAIPAETAQILNWPEAPLISAQSAILMDADTGMILYEKNAHEQLYPASTTKLLTCLIATERCSLDEVVTFSHEAIFDAEGSGIALDEGESLTMEQCLNAILIASANEVAYGVAEHITGTSWHDFADIMNERAAELGCMDSHFVNPNGLPHEDHYTSAYDLATIGRAFFANELLCKISSTAVLDLEPTATQPDHIIERSRNQLFPGQPYAYEYLVGSKTGYTNAARNTLVSCAQKDGMKLIAVVLVEESPAQFADTVALFHYGFQNFDKINISETETRYNIDTAGNFYSNHDIFGNSTPILSLNATDCIIVPKTISFSDITSEISYETESETEAALITYSYRGHFLGSVSVDFTSASNPYPFEETGAMQTSPSDEAEKNNGQKIIFINIFKIILWIVGIAAVLSLVFFLFAFFRSYYFGSRPGRSRSDRRSWQKNRRRRRRWPQKKGRR